MHTYMHMHTHTEDVSDLNVRTKTLKLLEDSIGLNLCELRLSNGFLDMAPKIRSTTKNKSNLIKIKPILIQGIFQESDENTYKIGENTWKSNCAYNKGLYPTYTVF